ncbi:MAG: DEAD/DEAH box helicase family protein, partial [Elusimicrobiales bacterium]|nr:DEAD/DEAH box helicase family protein [Elusimicrobiales bacterium]
MAEENLINDTKIIDEIIYGRVIPHIYAFTTQTVPKYLKIGDTMRPVAVRIQEWQRIFKDLKTEKEWEAFADADKTVFFRDYAVHSFLDGIREDGKPKFPRLTPEKLPGLPYYSQEFFENASIDNVENAIQDIKKQYGKSSRYSYYDAKTLSIQEEHYDRNQDYQPRPNQQQAIDNFVKAVQKGRRNLLMYAVMRFGKSFVSMHCAEHLPCPKGSHKLIVIVSAKADLASEWKKTIESHIKFKDYEFYDSKSLLNETDINGESTVISSCLRNKNAAVFLTLQDLKGKKLKERHKEIFSRKIDLLIIDETHFGARGEEYGKVLQEKGLSDQEKKQESKDGETQLSDVQKSISQKNYEEEDIIPQDEKLLHARIKLHLSGTPYRILMGSEFKKEDIISSCQFTDIANAQKEWDDNHSEDFYKKDEYGHKKGEPIEEWHNPYFGFPQMIRFAFNPNQSSRKLMESMRNEGISFGLAELLRPCSITKTKDGSHKEFKHKEQVFELLQTIDGSKADGNIFGFLDYKRLKDGAMCRHIVFVLPWRASCDAMQKLIYDSKEYFKNLKEYKILNIAGLEEEKEWDSPEIVKKAISDFENKGSKTITLTVNKMLTGSTVPEWDTMVFLKDTSSPQEYDQAVFRLQSQYVKIFKAADGSIVKRNMKPQTLLVDFDPARMFYLQASKAVIYNANEEKGGTDKLSERINDELAVSPIIFVDQNKLKKADHSIIIDAVRKYSAQKGIAEETEEIPVDFGLLTDENVLREISSQGSFGSRQGLSVNPISGEGDELELPDFLDSEAKNNKENKEKVPENNDKKKKDEKQIFAEKFRTYYARILFFSFLTKSKISSLKNIL